jgi:NADPH:quinone reductase-like Zn-dependent oxidoreductase
MRALRLHEDGLRLEQIPVPEPGPGEALVRVHAAAITRDELTWSTDRLPAIPSYELSGTLVDSGDEVVALTPFDRDGVAADHAVVPTALLTAKPPGLSHVEAAALVMGALTSQQGLFVHGRLQPGERVLVTGASGGVGRLAVQLARRAGAEVVVEELVELVFDTAGADPLPRGERVVTIAAEALGATYFVVEPDGAQLAEALQAGLEPAIDSVFPLERGSEAFAHVAMRGKRGKVVLDVAESEGEGVAALHRASPS